MQVLQPAGGVSGQLTVSVQSVLTQIIARNWFFIFIFLNILLVFNRLNTPKWSTKTKQNKTKCNLKTERKKIKWGLTYMCAAGEVPLWLQMHGCVFCSELCALCSRSCMSANHCSRMETWENSAVFLKSHRRFPRNFVRSFSLPYSSQRPLTLFLLDGLSKNNGSRSNIFAPVVRSVRLSGSWLGVCGHKSYLLRWCNRLQGSL